MSYYSKGKDVCISTGRVEIDQQMGGGIPWGYLTLVEGKHGVERSCAGAAYPGGWVGLARPPKTPTENPQPVQEEVIQHV